MKNMRYTAAQKLAALRMWIQEPTVKVCSKFRCSERALWRWKSRYNGTLSSLENLSTRPHKAHPKQHTANEVAHIKEILSATNMSYCEAYGILRTKHAYGRSYGGFYNYVVRHGIRPRKEIIRYVPKPYNTPDMIGTKWQMDVKFVPLECYTGVKYYSSKKYMYYYQYTMIDEATRERFIYPYEDHSVQATVDFVKRAIAFFGYVPEILQTDNGPEFTNTKKLGQKINPNKPFKPHALDLLCERLKITHKLIPAYTPRINGKVERSHRTDQEFFYNYLRYQTFDELKDKMLSWNIRYNNKPHASLTDRQGKKVWWTPNQKRADLELLLQEKKDEFEKVRFITSSMHKTIEQAYSLNVV